LYDSQHTLWVGNSNGILRIEQLDKYIESGFQGKPVIATGFPKGKDQQRQFKIPFYAMVEDGQGNIWAGALDGLYRYNRATTTVTKYIHDAANPQSISDNEIRSICLSKTSGVWIGTLSGGLNHLDTATGIFTAYTTANGLPNNSIYTILEDHNGHLWLGTNAGLCRFNTTDHSVRNYTPRDGIQNLEFNTNAASQAPNGLLCFGGTTGFNIFHPDSLSNGFEPPKAVITRFKIFDEEYAVPSSILTLPHGQNSFSFEFASLSYYRSSEHQYAYMLEGADKDWINSGNRHYTSYAHLPPGKYTFKVRVANHTGVWSKEITTLAFIINPAWYNTWWFRLAIGLLVAAGVYGLYSYRIRQMQKLYTVRNHIASDLHDEIGSTLSSISLMSGMMQRKLQAGDTAVNSLLLQVSSNTSYMLEALSDIVWAINSSNDRFDNVVNRMRAFAIELLEPADIHIDFVVVDDLCDLKLDMQQRKNLYLIFKEALHNTVKYAACTNVTIQISCLATKTLMLEIKDDGKGFDLKKSNTENISLSGNGIRNMKKRAAELSGRLDIISAPEKGTSILLVFTV
jgi:two-component sensor histidine kinase